MGFDAIVGRDYQDGNIRYFSAPPAHGRKGLVTGGVNKGYLFVFSFDLISADVLGNAAGFAGYDIAFANCVEELGFAVVNMAHYHNYRRSLMEIFLFFFRQSLL